MHVLSQIQRYSQVQPYIHVEVDMALTLTVTNAGYNLYRDASSNANSGIISYFALGTGNSTPIATQTQLDNEQFRKAVTSYTNGSGVGEILVNCYISPSDALGLSIAEIGIFGGNAASSSANSGVMIGRVLYSHTRPSTAIESLQMLLDLIF